MPRAAHVCFEPSSIVSGHPSWIRCTPSDRSFARSCRLHILYLRLPSSLPPPLLLLPLWRPLWPSPPFLLLGASQQCAYVRLLIRARVEILNFEQSLLNLESNLSEIEPNLADVVPTWPEIGRCHANSCRFTNLADSGPNLVDFGPSSVERKREWPQSAKFGRFGLWPHILSTPVQRGPAAAKSRPSSARIWPSSVDSSVPG